MKNESSHFGSGNGDAARDPPPEVSHVSAIGRRIIEHQIDTIERYHERNVVHAIVGYKKELIMDQSRNLIYIYNPRYSMDNTAVSLTRCFSQIDDDVIWINGDFTFKATIAKEAIAAAVRSRVAVTVTAVGGEELKYRLMTRGESASYRRPSKAVSTSPCGSISSPVLQHI